MSLPSPYICNDFLLTVPPENPTAKFGEALRAQVEERLNFFETGAPPSKNADAIRKVLDALALEEDDDDDDDGMDVDAAPLTSLEAEPKKEKKKKRKSESMEVDEDEEDSHTSKKVKLSKEEKKALKKAKKEKAKAEGGEVRSYLSLQSLVLNMSRRNRRKRRRRTKRRKKRRRKAKPSQRFSPSRSLALPVSPYFRSDYYFSYCNSKGSIAKLLPASVSPPICWQASWRNVRLCIINEGLAER